MKNSRINETTRKAAVAVTAALMVAVIALPAAGITSTDMGNYCSMPAFLGNTVPPNVMIVLSNASSMNGQAYVTRFNPTQFANKSYYGYFNPARMYQYDGSTWKPYTGDSASATAAATVANPIASGNLLNWATMRRIEVAKKLLIGGKTIPISPQSGQYVKLDMETSDPAWSFIKVFNPGPWLARPATQGGHPDWLVPGFNNVLYGPKTNERLAGTVYIGDWYYNFNRAENKLIIAPQNTANPLTPSVDALVAGWETGYTSAAPPAGDPAKFAYVNDHLSAATRASTYIQNRSSTQAALFGYNPLTMVGSGDITSVTVYAVIQRFSTTGKTQDKTVKFEVQGAIRVGRDAASLTTNYYAVSDFYFTAASGLAKDFNFNMYSFDFSVNPATGLPWTWDDIKGGSATPSLNFLKAFGIRSWSLPTADLYLRVAALYVVVNTAGSQYYGEYSLTVEPDDVNGVDADGNLTGVPDGSISKADIGGIIQSTTLKDARFGLGFFNCGAVAGEGGGCANPNDLNGGYVDVDIGFSDTSHINDMENSIKLMGDASGPKLNAFSPVAETLYEMLRYYRQNAPAYSSNDYTANTSNSVSNTDPYNYLYTYLHEGDPGSNLDTQFVPCAKSFILMLADGDSSKDRYVPTDVPETIGVTENLQNYDNDTSEATRFYPAAGSDYLDDVALWGRTTDARPGTCTSDPATWTNRCLPKSQYIYLYTVNMFGENSQLLKDAAINGGFEDLNENLLPDDPKEYLRDSNEDGVLNSSDLPRTYFEGDDGYKLEKAIGDALADILKRAASGTAVSVLTTSSRGVGSLVQAYFLPIRQEQDSLRQVSWTGYAQNIWLDPFDNLREDTANDLWLKLAEDRVMKLYFDASRSETMAATFTTDAEGNSSGAPGSLDSCSPEATRPFAQVKYLWEGGDKLAKRRPSKRNDAMLGTKVFTSSKVLRGTSTGSETTHTIGINDFTVSNITGNAVLSAALNPDDAGGLFTAENIVRYTLGECLETGMTGDAACGSTWDTRFRDRRVTVSGGDTYGNVWKLGDIISSTPKIAANTALNLYNVEYGDTTYSTYVTSNDYKRKISLALLGANDGMVHALRLGYLKDKNADGSSLANNVKAIFKNLFSSDDNMNTEIGEEAWAYIPLNSFPYLKYLANPSYKDCHIYFNDLSTRLIDVSIGGVADMPTNDRTAASWRTLLVGGMSFGGACAGGLNPTGPPAGAPANVGYSSYYVIDITDPAHPVPLWEFSDPDMGYSTTYPTVFRTGVRDKNGYWYVAVGSGSLQLPKSEGGGSTSRDIARNSTGYVFILDLKTGERVKKIPLDHNGIVGDIISVDADLNYTVEKLYFGTAYYSTNWKGKLVSIDIPNQDLNSAWTPQVRYLFEGDYPFTASPDAVKDENGTTWIYIGSGKYFSDLDESDPSPQVFLGVKDKSGITYPLTLAGLADRTNVETTGFVSETRQVCNYNASASPPGFELQTIVTSINVTSTPPPRPDNGWFYRLATSPTAERVISRPLAVGGLVDFVSYKPSADPCAGGGDSYLYSLAYTTGVAPSNVAILSSGVTTGTSGEITVKKGVKLGPGAPPRGEPISVTPQKEGQEELKKKIQVATGVIIEATNEPAISITSKIVHWLKK